jgi:Ca2+-binding EF-hand superfamily protein
MAKISNDQIEAIKAEFKKFDTNNDNKLSKKEYYIMLRTDGANLNEKHIKSFVNKYSKYYYTKK